MQCTTHAGAANGRPRARNARAYNQVVVGAGFHPRPSFGHGRGWNPALYVYVDRDNMPGPFAMCAPTKIVTDL